MKKDLNTCPNCGAVFTTSLDRCKYCNTPNPNYVETGNKNKNIQTTSNKSYAEQKKEKKFNVLVFILLLICFWPAAIVYAIVASGDKKKK